MINETRTIDIKDGKEIFYNSLCLIDETKPLSSKKLIEDLLALKYEHCIIDAGMYSDYALTIMVILIEDGNQNWDCPYCVIRCFDIDDFYIQLQRAINIYPEKCKELYNKK